MTLQKSSPPIALPRLVRASRPKVQLLPAPPAPPPIVYAREAEADQPAFYRVVVGALIVMSVLAAAIVAVRASDAPARPVRAVELSICAAYDIHLLTLIEDLGEAGAAAEDDLAAASALLSTARGACATGDFAKAWAAYEAADLPPVPHEVREGWQARGAAPALKAAASRGP